MHTQACQSVLLFKEHRADLALVDPQAAVGVLVLSTRCSQVSACVLAMRPAGILAVIAIIMAPAAVVPAKAAEVTHHPSLPRWSECADRKPVSFLPKLHPRHGLGTILNASRLSLPS